MIFEKTDIVLITGGSRGLGFELVKQFIKEDVTVIIVDIIPPDFEEVPEQVTYFECDISNINSVRELSERIKLKFENPSISVLINNAGIVSMQRLKYTSDSQIKKVIDVNLFGPILMTQMCLPDMFSKKRGYIINIASVLGLITPAGTITYGVSKAGLLAYHKFLNEQITLRLGYQVKYLFKNQKNVKTLLVIPGKIHTTMFDQVPTPSTLFAPDVDPLKLSQLIIKTIKNENKQIIRSPFYASLIPLFINHLNWQYTWFLKKVSGMDNAVRT